MTRPKGPPALGDFDEAKAYASAASEQEKKDRVTKTERLRALRLQQEEDQARLQTAKDKPRRKR